MRLFTFFIIALCTSQAAQGYSPIARDSSDTTHSVEKKSTKRLSRDQPKQSVKSKPGYIASRRDQETAAVMIATRVIVLLLIVGAIVSSFIRA